MTPGPGEGPRQAASARRAAGLLLALALAAALAATAGCAHLFGRRGLDEHGLPDWDARLRASLGDGHPDRALALLHPDTARAGDELLRLQHEALAAHYARDWDRSNAALERALVMAEDRYTKSVTKALLSMLASDRVLPYDPPHPERLLLHYYGALNWLGAGAPDEAAVEARRLGARLRRSLDGDLPATPAPLGRALSRFAGAVFEAAGQPEEAAVAYRRAAAFGGGRAGSLPGVSARGRDGAAPAPGGSASGVSAGTPIVALAAAAGSAGQAPTAEGDPARPAAGRVLVVIERGYVAHRVEQGVTLFLLPREARRLRGIRKRWGEEGADADPEPLLALARRIAERGAPPARERARPPPGGPPDPRAPVRPGFERENGDLADLLRGRRGRRADDRDGDPVLVRVAWPVFRETSPLSRPAELAADGEPVAADRPERVDLSRAMREDYERRRVLDVAKTLLRAVAKHALAEEIEEEVSEEDETLGEVAGWTARIAGALLERADTRSWHLLPARLELHPLELPAGAHRLVATLTRGGRERTLEIGTVEVEPGSVQVITARDWR